jgi:hypothetical protein
MAQNSGLKQSYTFMRIKAPKPNEPELAAFARKVNENFEAISTKIYNGIEYKNLHSSAQTAIDNKVKHATWRVVITCSGATETVGQQTEDVTLNADVFVLGKLATSAIDAAQFKWTRESGDSVADAAWNTDHTSMKSVTILAADRMKNALYTCEVTDPNSSAVASGSIALNNQQGLSIDVTLENGETAVQTRFIAKDNIYGLFRISDGKLLHGGRLLPDGRVVGVAGALIDPDATGEAYVLFTTDAQEDHSLTALDLFGVSYDGSTDEEVPEQTGCIKGVSVSVDSIPEWDGDEWIDVFYSRADGKGHFVIRGEKKLTCTVYEDGSPASAAFSLGTDVHPGGAMAVTGHLLPSSNNDYALGSTSVSKRWTRLYCVQSPDVSSDARLKTDIEDIDGSLIYKLRPRKFRMKDGSGKLRFGLIAQEVKTVLDELGIDGADLYGDKNPDSLSLVYEELIAPLIAAVQEQKSRIDDLESRLSALENRLLNQ